MLANQHCKLCTDVTNSTLSVPISCDSIVKLRKGAIWWIWGLQLSSNTIVLTRKMFVYSIHHTQFIVRLPKRWHCSIVLLSRENWLQRLVEYRTDRWIAKWHAICYATSGSRSCSLLFKNSKCLVQSRRKGVHFCDAIVTWKFCFWIHLQVERNSFAFQGTTCVTKNGNFASMSSRQQQGLGP